MVHIKATADKVAHEFVTVTSLFLAEWSFTVCSKWIKMCVIKQSINFLSKILNSGFWSVFVLVLGSLLLITGIKLRFMVRIIYSLAEFLHFETLFRGEWVVRIISFDTTCTIIIYSNNIAKEILKCSQFWNKDIKYLWNGIYLNAKQYSWY